MKLTITIYGVDDGDLELALAEVACRVGSGYLAGVAENNSGSYRFDVDTSDVDESSEARS